MPYHLYLQKRVHTSSLRRFYRMTENQIHSWLRASRHRQAILPAWPSLALIVLARPHVATVTAPIHMPIGTHAALLWYKCMRLILYNSLSLSHGYVPGPAFFESAIGVFWSEKCRSLRVCIIFNTGIKLLDWLFHLGCEERHLPLLPIHAIDWVSGHRDRSKRVCSLDRQRWPHNLRRPGGILVTGKLRGFAQSLRS